MSGNCNWPDIAGRIDHLPDGRQQHVLPVRVYYEDTDAGGVAYHAAYVRFCERGRTDFLRLLGAEARGMIDGSDSNEPAAFVVRRMTFDFARPAKIDDLLEIVTTVKDLGGASVTLAQEVRREGQRICDADVVVVLVSIAGKPLRLSSRMRAAFEAHTTRNAPVSD